MKLLLLHNYYSQQGGEDIVFQNEREQLKNILGKENVFEYTVKTEVANKLQIISSVLYSKKHYKQVYQLIKMNNIDIVHIHNYFPLLTISVFKAAKDAGAKVIHTAHNYKLWCISGIFYRDNIGICTLCSQPNNLFSGIRYKCYRNSFLQSLVVQFTFWIYNKIGLLKYMDKVIVLSKFQFEMFYKLGFDHTKLILKPNLIHYLPLAKESVIKNNYLFVGRLEYSKGIVFLLESWEKLPSNFILTIIGTGSLETELLLKYRSYSNIIFTGELNKEEISKHIERSKYSIQPSLWYETFGLTIIESMMLGTPVIGLNIGTRNEMITSGENGLLTTEADFIATIVKSEQYEGYDKMCKNAAASALKYLPEQIMQEQLNIYKELLH